MKFFIDTADIGEIREAHAMGLLDGVTTNPSLVAKTKRPFLEVIEEICRTVDGPVSAEVISTKAEEMIREGKNLAEIHSNIVVKIPLIPDGLKAVRSLSADGVKTNVTLCFSPLQALLAAKAGATYISPFVGRLDDISHNGMDIVGQILEIYENYGFETSVLVASIRHPIHVLEAAMMRAQVCTMPFKVISQLARHPLTDIGLQQFLEDSRKIPS